MKLEIFVDEWTDDIACPKCLQKDRTPGEEINFRLLHISDTPLLLLLCTCCGYAWLMLPANE